MANSPTGKKPAMPPPLGKKPVKPADPKLMAQTDDHKAQEFQKGNVMIFIYIPLGWFSLCYLWPKLFPDVVCIKILYQIRK